MLTDTIQISGLPETVIRGVSDRAKAVGATAEEYVRYLIEEDLSSSSLNLRVLFAPVREQIKQSGISENELTELLEEAREEVFQKNQPEKQVQKDKIIFSVVYDCMVFLQGLIAESGVAVNCFELFENGIVELFVSEEVLAEFRT